MAERQFYLIIIRDARERIQVISGIGTKESYDSKLMGVDESNIMFRTYGLTRAQDRIAEQITSRISGMPLTEVSDEISGLAKILTGDIK
ncbi:hypothetical protein HYT23_01430 [Candidatus Pacearchaeota archaeon]|nr:hypothetical protein [Candidatus Pacearchaeota archaeon]